MINVIFKNFSARIIFTLVLISALSGGFLIPLSANAAAVVTTATGGAAISADTVGESYTTITGPVVTENGADQIGNGTIILNAPTGFEFDTGGTAPTILVTCTDNCGSDASNLNGVASGSTFPITSRTSSAITITITDDTDGSVENSLTWQGVRVRPTAGTPLASGDITKSGDSVISGVSGSTNFGTLTEVAGVPTVGNSTFTCSPTLQAVGGISTCNFTVKDQFNNPVQNASVGLASTGDGNTFSTNPALTNINGQGTITLSSSLAQAKTVTATVNGSIILPTQSVTFYTSSPTSAAIVATPNPKEASLSGSDVSLAIAITDQFGNPVNDGIAVTVSGVANTSGTVNVTGSGTTVGGNITRTLNFNNKGNVTLTVNIASVGNMILTGDSVVNFLDTTKPVITVIPPNPATVEYRGTYTDNGATATDNIDGDITGSIVTVNPVAPSVINVVPDTTTKVVGVYTVTYNVSDTSGNLADVQTRTVNVLDTTIPVISSITSNAITTGALKIGDTVTFTLTPSVAEPVATVSGSSYNGQPLIWSTADIGVTYTATYTVVEGNPDQTSPLQISGVVMTDEAGNDSVAVSGTDVAKTIDANKPIISSVDSDGQTYNLLTVSPQTIKLTFSENIGLAPTVSISGDGAQTVTDCGDLDAKTFCFDYTIPSLTDNITRTITITGAQDFAGNVQNPNPDATHTFVVDTVAPVAPSTPDLDAGSDLGISATDNITKDNTPTFTGIAEEDTLVKLYDGAIEIGSVTATGGVWSITSGALADGVHLITATATDAAGNTGSAPGSLSVTIDTELVALSLTSVAPNPTNTSPIPVTAQFSQTVNGFEVGDIVVTNGVAGSFVAVDDDTYIFDVTPAGDGGVTVNVAGGVAQDTAGNDNTVAIELSRVYDATPPTVTLVTLSDADALVKMSDSLTITATFSEDMALAPDPMITLSGLYSEGPVAMTRVDATHYTYIHTVGAGDGLVTITIADGKDLATNTLIPHSSTTFTVDNTKPVIDAHADLADVVADSVPGATITYSNPSATDVHPVSPVVTCSLPSGSVFPMGLSTITCDATDDAGNDADSTTFTVTVVPALIAKVSVSPSPTSVTVPGPVTLTINGRDAFDHITTNQSGTVVVVSADNGGALDDSLVTLASGEAMTTLTKSSAGVVHVTVSSGILSPDSETVTFTASDTTGPEVTSFSPVLDATNVSVSAPIFVNFNEPLKFSTVNGTNIQLWIATTIPTQVSATVSLVDGGTRVNVIPLSSLDFSTDYYLIVTTDVQDETGNALTTPLSDSNTGFTTAADTADHTAPTIVDKNPADSETGVAITTTPSVTFSEAMLSSTIGPASVLLLASDDITVIPATISLVDAGTRALITPSASLSYSTVYHVAVTTGVTDEAGNALVAGSDTSFTTEAEPDAALAVTGIDAVDTFATADNTFENGWSWTFHVTVPTSETNFAMKFADFVSGANSIPAASNIRFYSAQSSDAFDDTTPITIVAADTYSANMTLATDLDSGTAGRQIDVTVEVRVPVGTPGGSYSTSYGVQSI